jgi:2-keto-4-pentenoate hydratase/2-oxohepta-3-ene-1,7-dioic acid hydratase in catechol pathway
MKLLRYGPKGQEKPGLLDRQGKIRDLSGVVPDIGPEQLSPVSLDRLRKINADTLPAVSGTPRLGPCVGNIGKLVCIGLNYRDHAEESNAEIPPVPVVFAILPSALIGPDDAIVVPREETRPDYECEVAVVIGQRTYRADRASAHAAIGGISAFNDVSGRRAQLETPQRQWTLGKSFDTFAPLGPCITSADSVDLANMSLRTTLSGEVMQQSNTRHLIFPVDDLIVYLSQGITLEPGDVIATGTPSGVGDSRQPPRYLREGDVVEVWVEGVGTLRNPVTLER